MPERPLPVDYADYYRRLFRQFLRDLFKLGSGQVIGALLSIAILVLQIHYGVIPRTLTLQSVESVLWPYLILVFGLCLLSAFRAPAQLDAEHRGKIAQLSSELELPDKAQAEYLRAHVAKLSENAKAIMRFVLIIGDEVSKQDLSTVLPSWDEVYKAYRQCLDLKLLKTRNDATDMASAMTGRYEVFWVPDEFRLPLKRILYES